jgi:hypothetical protein
MPLSLRQHTSGSKKLYTSSINFGSSMGGSQPQTWPNDIIFTPQVTWIPKSGVNLAGVNCNGIRVHPNALETAYLWLKHVICPIWIWEAVWGGSQPQPWCYDIIHNPQVTWIHKSGANWPVTWYVCTHMALRQHTSSSSNTLYMVHVDMGCGKWYEMDLSFNFMTLWHCSYSTRDLNSQIWVPTWPV